MRSRTSIGSIALGLCAAAAPAIAQPGAAPVPPPQPYPQPAQQPYPQPQQQPYPQPPQQPYPQPAPQPYAQPQPYAEPPPPSYPQGTTRATFVSTGEARWDVRLDDEAVCTTPCALAIDSLRHVTLHSQERSPARLTVGLLPPGDVLVQATPRAQGAFAAGVTFTSLSGMGLATGITLTAVGCSTDRDTMCKAGLITGLSSAAALYLSIDLLRSALPRVQVGPARAVPYAGQTVGLAGRF